MYTKMESSSKGCSLVPPSPKPYPLLMFTHGKLSKPIQTFYSIPENRSYMRRLPDLTDKIICASCEGWTVMFENDKRSDDCFLFNLASMEKINLPPFKDFDHENCVLSAPPTDPSCIVAFFDRCSPCAKFWRPGQENWVQHNYGSGSGSESNPNADTLSWVMIWGRKIYGFIKCRHLAMVDIVNGKIEVRLLGAKERPDLPARIVRHGAYWLEFCGELFLVYRSMLGGSDTRVHSIEVYKLDSRNLEWIKVENIGDRVFFLSDLGNCNSFACSATECGLKGNCIYFLNGSSLHRYDIEDDMIHTSLPCPNVSRNLSPLIYWVMLQPSTMQEKNT